MVYQIAIDFGTMPTGAVGTSGRPEVAQLGSQRPEIPSTVLLREDGTFLAGEATGRQGRDDPRRLAQTFKRRLGHTEPLRVGDSPFSAHALMALVLSGLLATGARQQEGPPGRVGLTCATAWAGYLRELVGLAAQLVDIDHVEILAEPDAAAVRYTAQRLRERFGLPLVMDIHPEHSIAKGAALTQATARGASPPDVLYRRTPPVGPRRSPSHHFATDAPLGALSRGGPGRRQVVRGRGLITGSVVAATGLTWSILGNQTQNTVSQTDPRSTAPLPSWTRLADLPVSLEGGAVAACQNKVWVVGGLTNDVARITLTTEFIHGPRSDPRTSGSALPTPVKSGIVDRIFQRNDLAFPASAADTISPPVVSTVAVLLESYDVCLVGGEMPGRRCTDWWCEQPGVASRLPASKPQRVGLPGPRIGNTIYVVGGYGATFQGSNRVGSMTPARS